MFFFFVALNLTERSGIEHNQAKLVTNEDFVYKT